MTPLSRKLPNTIVRGNDGNNNCGNSNNNNGNGNNRIRLKDSRPKSLFAGFEKIDRKKRVLKKVTKEKIRIITATPRLDAYKRYVELFKKMYKYRRFVDNRKNGDIDGVVNFCDGILENNADSTFIVDTLSRVC